MKYVSNDTLTNIIYAVLMKYIWNLQKLYFINTVKFSLFSTLIILELSVMIHDMKLVCEHEVHI